MQIMARRCFVPISPSDWVAKVFLTCDNMIAVQFKHGEKVKKVLPHGPGAYLGHGGVPQVCCLYPGTQGELAVTLYELAQVWSYAGEWVHTFLYKKFGYQLVAPPAECGNCCCAEGNLPNTLFATISNVSGCDCLAGTYQLTYQTGAGNWQSSSMTLCGTDNVIMALDCLENQYVFAINGSYVDAASVDCTTPSIVFNNLVMGSLCTGTVNVTVTA
jgi:hypothetical protein